MKFEPMKPEDYIVGIVNIAQELGITESKLIRLIKLGWLNIPREQFKRRRWYMMKKDIQNIKKQLSLYHASLKDDMEEKKRNTQIKNKLKKSGRPVGRPRKVIDE